MQKECDLVIWSKLVAHGRLGSIPASTERETGYQCFASKLVVSSKHILGKKFLPF